MQGIYTHIPETNNVPKEHNVAAILSLLFMVPISLVPVLTLGHLYTTTAPSCCIPASYCHLSATLQTMSIIVANLQDNRAMFRMFIALLSFSFDSPS
jgi:hypothetical protein